jgi:hypothetical protein
MINMADIMASFHIDHHFGNIGCVIGDARFLALLKRDKKGTV